MSGSQVLSESPHPQYVFPKSKHKDTLLDEGNKTGAETSLKRYTFNCNIFMYILLAFHVFFLVCLLCVQTNRAIYLLSHLSDFVH